MDGKRKKLGLKISSSELKCSFHAINGSRGNLNYAQQWIIMFFRLQKAETSSWYGYCQDIDLKGSQRSDFFDHSRLYPRRRDSPQSCTQGSGLSSEGLSPGGQEEEMALFSDKLIKLRRVYVLDLIKTH